VKPSLTALVLLAATGATAQTPTFSSRVETVRVDVLATEGGRPIPGLRPDDFEIRDDGVPQQVEVLTSEERALNLVLALDTSGSVSGARLAALRAASQAVIGELGSRDGAALLTFGGPLTLRIGLARNAERVREALEALPASGDTALVDASYAALVSGESQAGRGLVIVLSDGADTSSVLWPEAVLETARRSDVVVYGVHVSGGGRTTFLRDLCERTGGRLLSAGSTGRVRRTFLEVLEEFRHRYLLSYTPRGVSRGGWHAIKVRLKKHRGKVEARPGYLAGR
jgi:Ca-activated chloride channel family protein